MTLSNLKLTTRTVAGLSLCGLAGASSMSIAGQVSAGRGFDEDRGFELEHGSLVISSSTYDRTKGALSTLAVGTTLPNSATATASAVADNNYVTVWNNATVDASFGATSRDRVERR